MSRKLWGGAATADRSHSREIYALCDPRDNLIYYVGMSINAQERFRQHLHGYCGGNNQRLWLRKLKKMGLRPILLILETIDAGPDAYELAAESEQFWISELLKDGQPLLNVNGVTHRYSRE